MKRTRFAGPIGSLSLKYVLVLFVIATMVAFFMANRSTRSGNDAESIQEYFSQDENPASEQKNVPAVKNKMKED